MAKDEKLTGKLKNIIFDMDGTLIDSSRGVLNSLMQVCLDNNIALNKKISKTVIGPPLKETLVQLTDIKDEKRIEHLVDGFKRHYDSDGYKDTTAFEGIELVLKSLYENRINLYIATNKRQEPTKKIIHMLKWDRLFKGIYSIDSFGKDIKTKGELLAHIVRLYDLKECIYIGDHVDDFYAANFSGLNYIMVGWGFGNFGKAFNGEVAANPIELVRKLLRN